MKRRIVFFCLIIVASLLLFGVNSCKKDEEGQFTLASLMAGNVDLNGTIAPTNVATDPAIIAIFSSGVDPSTATTVTISLIRDYDGASIGISVSVVANSITIEPDETLGNGTVYELNFLSGIKGTNGKDLTPFSKTFTTVGTFAPSGMLAYWNFENNADDQVGSFDPVPEDMIDVVYVPSRNAAAGTAAAFNGSTTLIEIPDGGDLMTTSDFTISFWIYASSASKTNGHFVMGLAGWYGFQFEIFSDYSGCKLAAQYDLGNGSSQAEDLLFLGDGNLGWPGWTYCRDLRGSGGVAALVKDKWAQVACVYDGPLKSGTMYINGERMKAQDFNLWPAGDPMQGITGLTYAGNPLGNNFVFGFIQGRNNRTVPDNWANYADPNNSHFKGWLDDVRIYHKALTEQEISMMYNSENL